MPVQHCKEIKSGFYQSESRQEPRSYSATAYCDHRTKTDGSASWSNEWKDGTESAQSTSCTYVEGKMPLRPSISPDHQPSPSFSKTTIVSPAKQQAQAANRVWNWWVMPIRVSLDILSFQLHLDDKGCDLCCGYGFYAQQTVMQSFQFTIYLLGSCNLDQTFFLFLFFC